MYAVDGTTVYSYWSLYDFGSDTLALRALHTTDGTQRWRQQLPSRLRSVAVVGDLVWTTTSEAGIYGGQGGQLTAWSPADGAQLANVDFTTRVQAGTAFAGGRAFVQAAGLHAIGTGATLPTVTTKALRSGRVGTPYAEQLAVSGGTPPYTWSIASGSLPAGVAIAANGALSGTPTAAGAPLVTFRVRDAANRSVTAPLVLQVGSTGGTSAWSTGRYDASHNAFNPAETGVGLDHAIQMASRWKTAANAGSSSPSDAISVGGRLYATGMDGVLRAWSATGTTTNRVPVWTASADPNEQLVSAPTESAGTLYVVGSDAAVYAIRASDGVRLWRQTTDPDVSQYASPVAAPLVVGGKVIVAGYRPNLGTAGAWALSASTGALAWGGVAKDLTVPGANPSVQLPAASDGSRVFIELGCEVQALDLATGATVVDGRRHLRNQRRLQPLQLDAQRAVGQQRRRLRRLLGRDRGVRRGHGLGSLEDAPRHHRRQPRGVQRCARHPGDHQRDRVQLEHRCRWVSTPGPASSSGRPTPARRDRRACRATWSSCPRRRGCAATTSATAARSGTPARSAPTTSG